MKKLLNILFTSREERLKAKQEAERIRIEKLKSDLTADITITCGNINYIKSYTNVLSMNLHTSKGGSAAETRRKRDWIRTKIEWLSNKLTEETAMLEYYKKELGSL